LIDGYGLNKDARRAIADATVTMFTYCGGLAACAADPGDLAFRSLQCGLMLRRWMGNDVPQVANYCELFMSRGGDQKHPK